MLRLILTVLSVVLVFASFNPTQAADAEKGKALYAKQCANCHGPNGEGKASVAKMLKVELRHLGSKEVQAKSDAELKKTILEGTGKMKPVKTTDSDAADVVAFVRTLTKK